MDSSSASSAGRPAGLTTADAAGRLGRYGPNRVEANQADRPPQVFTTVHIHHVITGVEIDSAAIEKAIRLSDEKYCSVGAMVKQTAMLETTYDIAKEATAWAQPSAA